MTLFIHSKRFVLCFGLLCFLSSVSTAQVLIKGIISDNEANPLINATVYKLNKIIEGYSITSYDGRFEINASLGDTLVVSCIGYDEQRVIADSKVLKVILEVASNEVVLVTGLGISRSEQELGYAIQGINNESFSYSKSHNFIQALQGRAVGAQITSNASGPIGAVSLLIRGESSLLGKTQPLFILNGMPITNDLFSSGDGNNGSSTIDFGNAAQLIGVDDIASVSILRGASAAIAYGSRAANGVILITTKNGQGQEGWSVHFNSSTNFETPLKLPDYQNQYGSGGNGMYSYNGGFTRAGNYYDASGQNWGPRMNGASIKQWNSNGKAVPFTANANNISSFYRPGFNTNNNIDLIHGGNNGDFRLSFSSLYKEDIVPNSNLHKHTMLASFGQKVGKKVSFRANALYTLTGSDNVPGSGYDEESSVLYSWLRFPRNGNISDFKDYWKPGLFNEQQNYAEELSANNPWFVVQENTNSFLSHRFIANATLNVDIIKGLSFRFRGGADILNSSRHFQRAYSTRQAPLGSYRYDDLKFSELNIEALLSYSTDQDKPFRFTISLIGNMMRQSFEFLKSNAPELNVPGIYNLENAQNSIFVDNFTANKGTNSLFLVVTGSYKKMLHIELAGRADKFSTSNNKNGLLTNIGTYLYPSATLSAVLSEIFNIPETIPISFAKLRFAYGQVQADLDPYQLQNTYSNTGSWGGISTSSNNSLLKNPDLQPEITESVEAGFEIRFLKDRLSLDATYYFNSSKNVIFNRTISPSSGFTNKIVNDGIIENQGVELMLKATPLKSESFSWDITTMASFNQNKVVSLGEGVNSIIMTNNMFPSDAGEGLSVEAVVGQPLGQLTGYGFLRNGDGQIIHQDGLPVLTPNRISVGSYSPDWLVGIENTVRFQDFSFSILFDGQIGGKIYSRTHAIANTHGTITNYGDPNLGLSTLDGRVEYDISYNGNGEPVYTLSSQGGIVGPGVMLNSSGQLVPNSVKVSTQDYFQSYYGNEGNGDNIEAATFDATYFKLREVRLSYRIPSYLLKKSGIKNITVSLVGRNLALFSATPTIDPETFSIRSNKIVHGIESGQMPSTRSFGINLNIEF